MNDQNFLTNFDGAEDRRRVQNRMAQRKYREKIKSQRQNSYSKGHNRVVISNDSYNSEDQNGPRHQTLNNILHEFNIMQSTNGVQAQSINPQMNVSASSLQKEQVHSSMSTCSPSEGHQLFNDQFLFLDQPQANSRYQVDGHQRCPKEPHQELKATTSGYINNQDIETFTTNSNPQQDHGLTNQATAVVQSQRIRICDQAEEHLEKALSLYDFGVSLEILVADPHLRDLLEKASMTFNSQRFINESGEIEFAKDQ